MIKNHRDIEETKEKKWGSEKVEEDQFGKTKPYLNDIAERLNFETLDSPGKKEAE